MDYATAKAELDRLTEEQKHAEYMRSKLHTAIDSIYSARCEEVARGGYSSPYYDAAIRLLKDVYESYEQQVIDTKNLCDQQKDLIVRIYFGVEEA